MNKLNKLSLCLMLMLSSRVFAGDCTALSGQYTIGKSETVDFTSIGEAVAALKCGGVSGPVTFLIENGTYNERLSLASIQGTSSGTPITFQSKSGNNTEVVISYASADATLLINGISNLNFENLTFDHKTATYGNCLRVDGRANKLRFKGVVFDGVEVARPGANSATVYFSNGNTKNDIVFEDCEVNNGSIGLYKNGISPDAKDSKTAITGTLFFNQFESALALANEDAPVISNNVFSTLSTFKGFKAISLDNIANNLVISNNIVNAANGSIGLEMHDCVAEPTMLGQINNNSIAVGGNGEAYGILLSGTTDNQVINFNRVKLTISGAQASNQAYYRNSGSGNNVNMMNNIMYDLNTGGYTIIGNSYKDFFNQLPGQSNASLTVSANGIMIEKVSPIK